MYRFFDRNFNRPKGIDVNGRIYVEFVMEEDGSIGQTSIKRGLEPLFDDEALRVVRAMPKWKPAMEGGKPIRCRMVVPLIVH